VFGVVMARLMKWLVLVLVVIGAMMFLSSRVSEQPLSKHEKAVSVDALAK
jgi:HAMP domain-containing protein